MSQALPRRAFLTALAAGLAAGALAACGRKNGNGGASTEEAPKGPGPGAPDEGQIPTPPPTESTAAMPMRTLGRTGVQVSLVGLGGYHIGFQPDEQESLRIIRSALDRGVTFMDNCWDYNSGRSEERMGKALRDGYRDKAFLMTKLDGRNKKAAAEQLEQSLRRLGVDRIDLVQIHEVIYANDPERCFAPGGCMEALLDARKAGKLRFIGFTGHKDPEIHLAMIRTADANGFTFDAVQMPLNVMDAHFKSFEKKVLPVAISKGMGILGMKALSSSIILKSNTATATECLQYAMSLPTSTVITGCDTMGVLDQAVQAALSLQQPLQPAQMTALLEKTRAAAQDGRYEPFKTSTMFDGTTRNPQWLESASI